MYLLDSSSIITPFHKGQLSALSLALGHDSPDETRIWLEGWFERGFASGKLVITKEVYDEVVRREEKRRPEQELLKRLSEKGQITVLRSDSYSQGEFYSVLVDVDQFVRKNYDEHQADAFLRKFDPFLVAIAKVYGATIVSEERHFLPERDGLSGTIKGEPRLPFVAWVFGVRCVPLLAILSREKIE